MSVHVTSPIWKLKKEHGISSTQKLILVKIGDCAWDDGSNAFPKIATIAKETCLEKRTVQKNLRELEEKKFLLIQKEATYDFPTIYKVNIKKIKAIVLGDELDSPPIFKGESDDIRDEEDSPPEVNLNTEGVNLSADRGEPDSPKPLINHHINHQKEFKDSSAKKTADNGRPPKPEYNRLRKLAEDTFYEITQCPELSNQKEKNKRVYTPLIEMLDLVEWNEYKIITLLSSIYERMKDLTFDAPDQWIKTARSIIRESRIGKGELRSKEVHEMTGEEFDAYLDQKAEMRKFNE